MTVKVGTDRFDASTRVIDAAGRGHIGSQPIDSNPDFARSGRDFVPFPYPVVGEADHDAERRRRMSGTTIASAAVPFLPKRSDPVAPGGEP